MVMRGVLNVFFIFEQRKFSQSIDEKSTAKKEIITVLMNVFSISEQ